MATATISLKIASNAAKTKRHTRLIVIKPSCCDGSCVAIDPHGGFGRRLFCAASGFRIYNFQL
jgi:hypothetical protein